jgi:xanthine dehydrogenase accessory factor
MPGVSRQSGDQDRDDIVEYPMTCHSGGALEILIEPVLPAPRLFIVGETPIVTTLIELARVMGYRVNQFERAADLALRLGGAETPVFVVVASMGVDDEEALAAALRAGASYVALVASPRRAAVVREMLAAMGVSPDDLVRLKAPAGLDIGARTQEEIALSIMAEIAQVRSEMKSGTTAGISVPDPVAALELEAIDPVCGMTVTIADARHQTEYDGKIWYFCCGGCKARFEADPLPYLTA